MLFSAAERVKITWVLFPWPLVTYYFLAPSTIPTNRATHRPIITRDIHFF